MSESRVVIVTGATSGLGRAMATALLDAGHSVVAFSRTAATVEEFVSTGIGRWGPERVCGVVGSVLSAADSERVVNATIERFGRIDGLINNAGIHQPTEARPRFFEISEEQWRAIVDTHLTGSFIMARAVVPHLIQRGWGRIVNHETSYATMLRARSTPYGAAKAGLEAATAGWAQELDGTGVTVNAILPGGVANVPRIDEHSFPDRANLVQPESMGPPIVWLMSEASDGLTGHRVTARLWKSDASGQENLAAAAVRVGWQHTTADARGR